MRSHCVGAGGARHRQSTPLDGTEGRCCWWAHERDGERARDRGHTRKRKTKWQETFNAYSFFF